MQQVLPHCSLSQPRFHERDYSSDRVGHLLKVTQHIKWVAEIQTRSFALCTLTFPEPCPLLLLLDYKCREVRGQGLYPWWCWQVLKDRIQAAGVEYQ